MFFIENIKENDYIFFNKLFIKYLSKLTKLLNSQSFPNNFDRNKILLFELLFSQFEFSELKK